MKIPSFVSIGLLLTLTLLTTSPTLADMDETELFKEVPSVIGASKHEQKTIDAPSSISIVTAKEIKTHGYRNLSDILRAVRGFYVTYDRRYEYLGVRGFGRPGDRNSRVLLLVDGHRLNDNIFDGAAIGNDFPFDVELIDRVEIIRGPSSAVYGTGAFLAVINVVLKRGRHIDGGEISADVSDNGARRYRGTWGEKRDNGWEYSLSLSSCDNDGEDLFFPEFNAETRDTDFEDYKNFMARVSNRSYTLFAAQSSRTKGVPGAPGNANFDDPRSQTEDEHTVISLGFERPMAKNGDLFVRFSFNRHDRKAVSVFDDPPFGTRLNYSNSLGEWITGEVRYSQRDGKKRRFTIGTDFRENSAQEQDAWNAPPYELLLTDISDESLWGLYYLEEWELGNNLALNLGMRYDRYYSSEDAMTPRLALIKDLPNRASLRFVYGEAFRAPSAFERYYHDGPTTQKSNPNLEAEEIETYELIYDKFIGDDKRFSASLYRFDAKDLISQRLDLDGLLLYDNIDEANATGFEFEFETRFRCGIESQLNYAIQRAEDGTTGMRLANSPRHLGSLLLAYEFANKARIGLEVLGISSRHSTDGTKIGGQGLTNITFTKKVASNPLELSLSVYNIFDKEHEHPVSSDFRRTAMGQDGRTIRLKATIRF